jgi:hypothetical protein
MRSLVLAFVLALAACGGDDSSSGTPLSTNPGDNTADGGSGGSSTTPPPAGDAGPVSCGTKSCNAGEYCCDGKCGLCAPIGKSCPATTCQ